MPIANHQITDDASFTGATDGARRVAGLYFYMSLDVLVDLAHKVSLDFFARPHMYTNVVDAGLAEKLAKLRARYGSDERVPAQEHRIATFVSLFGPPNSDSSDFARYRNSLTGAASAFAERVFDTGEEMLREAVRTAHRPFKQFLAGLEGASLTWSRDEVFPEIAGNLAYPILKAEGVVSVFGISSAPADAWPYTEDSNGDKAVAAVAQHPTDGNALPHTGALTREGFSQLQRCALRGAEALATIIDYDEAVGNANQRKNDLNQLITKCYTWGSSLGDRQRAAGTDATTIEPHVPPA